MIAAWKNGSVERNRWIREPRQAKISLHIFIISRFITYERMSFYSNLYYWNQRYAATIKEWVLCYCSLEVRTEAPFRSDSHLTGVLVSLANGTVVTLSCVHFWTPNEWVWRPEMDSEFTDLKFSDQIISHPRQNAAFSFWVAAILRWAKKWCRMGG